VIGPNGRRDRILLYRIPQPGGYEVQVLVTRDDAKKESVVLQERASG
jgi:hypothetical protein